MNKLYELAHQSGVTHEEIAGVLILSWLAICFFIIYAWGDYE